MPQTVHVYPNNDLIDHDTDGGDCPCWSDAGACVRCGWGVRLGHHTPQPRRKRGARMTLTREQRVAWLAHKCIDCLKNPTRAAGYRCDNCHRKQQQETAK